MPSIAQEDPTIWSKKRRWDDHSSSSGGGGAGVGSGESMGSWNYGPKQINILLPLSNPAFDPHPQLQPRLIKSAKRQRVERTYSAPLPLPTLATTSLHSPTNINALPNTLSTDHHHLLHTSPLSISPSEAPFPSYAEAVAYHNVHDRTARSKTQPPMSWIGDRDGHQQQQEIQSQGPQGQSKDKKKDLSPCHICHRRPTLLQELDSYTYCEGCGERTCAICIRSCEGYLEGDADMLEGYDLIPTPSDQKQREIKPTRRGAGHGNGSHQQQQQRNELKDRRPYWGENGMTHRSVVCSKCCVERGAEGDIWCFGCLSQEGGCG